MLKVKLQYFGVLMRRVHSLEKTLMLGGIEGRRRKGRQKMRWLDGILPPIEMRPSFISSNLVESREAPLTPQYPSPLRGTWEVP